MGGDGSGRRWRLGKTTTTEMRRIDIRQLYRDKLLSVGWTCRLDWVKGDEKIASLEIHTKVNCLVLDSRTCRDDGAWQSMKYPVQIVWATCNLGGQRPWFLCPATGCGRRVAILYGGSIFACRHCHQLTYDCQRETGSDRALRRAHKIRTRLGWPGGILAGSFGKPESMHWHTFERLKAQHDQFAHASLGAWRKHWGCVD